MWKIRANRWKYRINFTNRKNLIWGIKNGMIQPYCASHGYIISREKVLKKRIPNDCANLKKNKNMRFGSMKGRGTM